MCSYEIYFVDYCADGGIFIDENFGNYLFVWEVFIAEI